MYTAFGTREGMETSIRPYTLRDAIAPTRLWHTAQRQSRPCGLDVFSKRLSVEQGMNITTPYV